KPLEGSILNSVVCIAQVPDTEARIKIAAGGRRIDEAGLKFIVSPYDEFALEEAIRLKEAKGGDVTVVAFGPDRVQQALRECLARGATKALHLKGEVADADSLGIAKVVAAAITAQKGLNEPRYASLKGIMAAKKITIETKTISDLGLQESDIYNQRVKLVSLELPPEKTGGRKIDGGDAATAAREILKFIREEAKAL